MRSEFFPIIRQLLAAGAVVSAVAFGAGPVYAEPAHGIAMYGDPALPAGFTALPYANPDAPKGGRIVIGEAGGFDSMNPYILKGRAPWGVRAHVYESLMGRSWDEPFTLYGLLAESIETGPNREWVEFTLREKARFSDGAPVTVEDVIWSYETIGTQGSPRYTGSWSKVESIRATGPRSLRITFNVEDRELALLMGLRPVLQKAQWEGRNFEESSLDVPVGSGAYMVDDFEPGRFITFKRNPDYWGNDLNFMRGQANLDEIRYDYFGDGSVVFEAFKAGEITTYREFNEVKWNTAYDFPLVQSGDVVKSTFPHKRPTGITGFVMNTRRDQFKDWRVRQAMIHAFNFEFINETINGGSKPRITSYFSNSVLGMEAGTASGQVKELLEPFADTLLPGAIDGYALPQGSGGKTDRKNIRAALALFEASGWSVQDGVMQDASGKPFTVTILLKQGASETKAISNLYSEALKALGIDATIEVVDSAQYKERTKVYDFDMAYYRRGLSLSPGNEQMLYWGSAGVENPGTRNWMGMNAPAAEAMITTLLTSDSRDTFVAATNALDRVLTPGRYVVPSWTRHLSTVAHVKELRYPERLPMYGDWLGFQPDVWWFEE